MRWRRRTGGLLLLVVLVLTGCSTLPVSGPVHTRPDQSGDDGSAAPYFVPPGPSHGDDQAGIVRGFLLAMQANPPSTAIAREFLSARARASWKPVQGTIVYDSSVVVDSDTSVEARLSDAHRLDPRGAWVGGAGSASTTIPYTLVQQHGQWRIDNPPNALAVPASDFSSLFAPFTLYFYDRSGTVLVPTRVYIPRGEQSATNLVRALLAGPSGSSAPVAVTAFPPRTDLDLAVVVNAAGVAEIPLSQRIQQLAPADLHRVVIQLARTLRQVPGIARMRITVDGTPLPLAGAQTDVDLSVGAEIDPEEAPPGGLVAIAGHRVVRTGLVPIGGPLGRTGFALRSVALDVARHEVAGVATAGTRLYLAADDGPTNPDKVASALGGSTDLLRPVYDRFGALWDVDETAAGAVVHVLTHGHDRVLAVPGISGRRISAFTLTSDGSRMVATLASGSTPTVLVSLLLRDVGGALVKALAASEVQVSGTDLGPAIDLAQDSPTTVAVLTRPFGVTGRVVSVELDGSPGVPSSSVPDLVPGTPIALIASPDPTLFPQAITTDHRLLQRDGPDSWNRVASGVVAGAYPQ
ncbi:MAG: hypothetical protein JWP74_1381 [Marmoricola sp.]|nr:hypothetical protein [Marmoricola sp.]